MAPKVKSRVLPKDRNALIDEPEERSVLVKRCRSSRVDFDDFSVYVIRLKESLPMLPGSRQVGSGHKFLMRMRDTDYFAVYPMFELAFPYATEEEKETEVAYLDKHYPIVRDAKIKGIYLTGEHALKLAKDYGLEEYILALQEVSPGKPAHSLTGLPPVTPELTPAEPRRSRRSTSPKKKPAKTAKPRKKKGSAVDEESVRSGSPSIAEVAIDKVKNWDVSPPIDKAKKEAKEEVEKVKKEAAPYIEKAKETAKEAKDGAVPYVEKAKETAKGTKPLFERLFKRGKAETQPLVNKVGEKASETYEKTKTGVKSAMEKGKKETGEKISKETKPIWEKAKHENKSLNDKVTEDTKPILDSINVGKNDAAELLAAAKAQVDAAVAEEQTSPPTSRVKRALDIDEESPAEETTVKRARVDDLEREFWAEGRRGRALLGLAVGLGVSVVLPYLV